MAKASRFFYRIRLKKAAPYIKGDVLDIGCGPAFIVQMAKNIKTYTGIEFKEKAVENLKRKYPKNNFIRKDMENDKLNFKEKFDTIVLTAFVEHIANQNHLFSEISKAIKPGGIVLITTPTKTGNFIHGIFAHLGILAMEAKEDHKFIYAKKDFKNICRKYNFRLKKYLFFELWLNQFVVLEKLTS